MLCNKCGKELRDGAEFCPNCGTKVENKNSHAKLPIPMIIAALGIVLVIAVAALLPKTPSEEAGKNNTQDTQNASDSQQNTEESNKPKYPAIDAEKFHDTYKYAVTFDESNTCYVRKTPYKEQLSWCYYEVEFHTHNGYGYDLNFSFVHHSDTLFQDRFKLGKLEDHCLKYHNYDSLEESSYYLWAGTGACYGQDSYDEAMALKNNDKYFGEIPRVEGGESVVNSTDNYVKIYYAVENETHKGYEGMIYDGSKKKILKFMYVENKAYEYDEERVKLVVESIDIL